MSVRNLQWMFTAKPVHDSGSFVKTLFFSLSVTRKASNSAKISELLKG